MSEDAAPRSLTPAERRERRRGELKAWIASSQRVQRRLWIAFPIGVAAAFACALFAPLGVPFAILGAVSFWGVGRYITAAHIADWRLELENFDAPLLPIAGREED
jgi:hypothetical protein